MEHSGHSWLTGSFGLTRV
jgi:hypothetical protein